MLRLWRAKGVQRVAPTTRTDYGAGVCPFAEGVALGSCLPDSIIVGRITPIGSGFVVRGFDPRGALVCPVRGSFF